MKLILWASSIQAKMELIGQVHCRLMTLLLKEQQLTEKVILLYLPILIPLINDTYAFIPSKRLDDKQTAVIVPNVILDKILKKCAHDMFSSCQTIYKTGGTDFFEDQYKSMLVSLQTVDYKVLNKYHSY